MSRKILSPQEVCEMMNRSLSTLNRWWKAGRFPRPLQNQGRTWGWSADAIDDWLKRQTDDSCQ
ncbi:helix-turn-helix transcriptional regulator [Vibrio furnissii]|nr:helix-turn-helix domain-containing protein [Vibrio furnissii]